jgi:hypothetical protein
MPEKFNVSVDFGTTIPPNAAFDRATFPNLSNAVARVAQEAHARWTAYAAGAPLPNGQVINDRTGTYLKSIQMTMTGDFSALVYSNLPYAQAIESGSPARDMKTMLNSSFKVRVAKDGSRYLIIPFRWNVPNTISGHSMPQAVHNWWSAGARDDSHITGQYRRVSGTGTYDIKTRQKSTVPGWRYKWGTRLTENDMQGMNLSPKQESRMAGMVRFRNPKPKQAGHNSQYLSFRVMSSKSTGWMMPSQPGKWPARTVAEGIQKLAEDEFRAAVEADIQAFINKL